MSIKLEMQCEVCGQQATFRMSGDAMVCNMCDTPIAVGRPANEKWKVYQETLAELRSQQNPSSTKNRVKQDEYELENLQRDAERVNRNEPEDEEEYSGKDYTTSDEDEDENEEEDRTREYHAEEFEQHDVKELVTLMEGTLGILKLCKETFEKNDLLKYLPALPKGYEDIRRKFTELKSNLGYSSSEPGVKK